MMTEPVLSQADASCWDMWRRTAVTHAKLLSYRRHVDQARRSLEQWFTMTEHRGVMWSGGKDSTALAHLAVAIDPGCDLISEKDDLDYPGEKEYVGELGQRWRAKLTIVVPDVSPSGWIDTHCDGLSVLSDFHSRASELSKVCFYGVIEAATQDFDGIALGLRKGESRGRLMNRVTRGTMYRAHEKWVCQPLADWTGLDVMAYAETNGIELLPVYHCVGLMHSRDPWRIRKSWWLTEASSVRYGGVVWLRHYYPSLYRRLCGWLGDARLFT